MDLQELALADEVAEGMAEGAELLADGNGLDPLFRPPLKAEAPPRLAACARIFLNRIGVQWPCLVGWRPHLPMPPYLSTLEQTCHAKDCRLPVLPLPLGAPAFTRRPL
jgi:hypothetical protein